MTAAGTTKSQQFELSMDDTGILHLRWEHQAVIETADAEEAVRTINALCGSIRHPLLVEMATISRVSREARAVFGGSGYPTEEVAAETEGFGSDFLILNRVEIAKGWRGRGLGRWFAAEALDTLSHGADFAATYPAPIDESRGEARKAAENKLRDVWGDIGFQPLSGDVMILDLNLVTLDSTLQSMRKKFGAL